MALKKVSTFECNQLDSVEKSCSDVTPRPCAAQESPCQSEKTTMAWIWFGGQRWTHDSRPRVRDVARHRSGRFESGRRDAFEGHVVERVDVDCAVWRNGFEWTQIGYQLTCARV